ncbi:MAG: hypothetical protein ACRD3J_03320, partial [Thermoanaerobaculia bacterium]
MMQSQVKRILVPMSVAACWFMSACADQHVTAPTTTAISTFPPDVSGIEANEEDSLSLFVTFNAPMADSVRAVVTTLDGRDSTVTVARKREMGRFSLLGLQPRTPYRVVIEAWKGSSRQISPEHIVATGSLPVPIGQARLDLLNGSRPGSGYILAPMITPTTSYLVIF